ncbi:MAG TPA: alkaline phosphatase family protein [Longimicrobiales bacterium]|nr:alkaline phosphatase family protein [Longimicrobiales bacterium]
MNLSGFALPLALLAAPVPAAPAVSSDPPALIVLIAVDQFRGDYAERFAPNLTGGLARFREEGTFYANGRQDHALTATAPGHATMLSGRTPARMNILTNDHGVPDPGYPLIAGAAGAGASPARFQGTALYDWMLAADPSTRALSISRKDRGAILPVGRSRADVYWWADERYTTSTYYRDTLPSWVSEWNASLRPEQWAGREWTLLLPESAYPEPDEMPHEGVGAGRGNVFPHRMERFADVAEFPWSDSLSLDLALAGVRNLGLGTRGGTDLLVLSLSSLDAIGHDFGPDSREVHDLVLRVDRWLDWFMRELEDALAADQIVYVLTSDHGIATMPAYLLAHGTPDAGRIELRNAMRPVLAPLQQQFASSFALELQSGVVLADTAAMAGHGIDVPAVGDSLARRLAGLPGVARVFTPHSLAAAPDDDEAARLWRRSIPPAHAWLALAEPAEGWVFTASQKAEHGTPLVTNRHVPVAFLGAGIPAVQPDRVVRTVDIAPTLAAILGITPAEVLDGVVLQEVIPLRAQ